jgi:phosphopantetheinyl transferase (holo-ACP synthase)
MMSIGNDIISLAHINVPRTITPRFYSKFVTTEEIVLHKSPACAGLSLEVFVWLVWSVKESAYKYLSRLQPSLIFSPLRMYITAIHPPLASTPDGDCAEFDSETFSEDHFYRCTVLHDNVELYARSLVNTHLIQSIVTRDETANNIRWGIKNIGTDDPHDQSASVRTLAMDSLSAAYPSLTLSFDKTNTGCPIILNKGNETGIPVSFTHHYQFVAYSYLSDLQD